VPSDSISSFDASASKYTVAPTLMQQKRLQQPQQKGAASKDTIETPKAKGERLNPIQVVGKTGNVSGDQAVKIARAGRFVFFSIALPPFFLMYSLPKMFALNVLPAMLAQVDKGLQHAKKLLQQINKWVTTHLMNPFRNALGKIKWAPKGAQKLASSMMDFISRGFRSVANVLYRPVKAVYQTTKKVFERVKVKVQARYGSLVKGGKKVVNMVGHKVKQQATTVYQATVQPVVNWMLPKVKTIQFKLQQGIRFAKENIQQFARKVVEAFKPIAKITQQAATAMQAAVAKAMLQITQYAQPAINLFVSTYQFLKKQSSFGLRWLKQKPFGKLVKFQKATSKFIRGLVPLVGKGFGRAKQKYRRFKGKFSKGIKGILPFMPLLIDGSNEVYGKMMDFLKKVWLVFRNFVKAIYFRFERQLSPIKKGSLHFAHFSMNQLKKITPAPGGYLSKVTKKSVVIVSKVVKFGVLVAIGVGLVFKYWFAMLFDIAEGLSNRSRKKQVANK
jgi:hypothetical protein